MSTSVFAGGGVFSRFSDVGMCGDAWGYIGAYVVGLSCGLKVEVIKRYPRNGAKVAQCDKR